MDPLETISPIDGRYERYTKPLQAFFSERGLIKYRVLVEGEYFIFLSEHPQIGTRAFSAEEKQLVRGLYGLPLEEAKIVKAIETQGYEGIPATNHDVKAVEYYLKTRLKDTSLQDSLEWIHFGLTSEDVNNLAYGLMMSDGITAPVLTALDELCAAIEGLAGKYKDVPMLGRTHGQPASPTAFGKEFKVFSSRLKRQIDQLSQLQILVKLNGATGNYNALEAAYPGVDWLAFSGDFIERFNPGRTMRLQQNLITTQIESHDSYAEMFDTFRRINTILLGFNKDLWQYISDSLIIQKPVAGEIGSSTMPHKVNPIDFENSEGNLGIANALFAHFSEKLPISRLQRDLSDSTVLRNIGTAFAYSLIAYRSALKGLGKIAVDEQKAIVELEKHPEVITEAYQTILRREGVPMPYEKLRELTRGKVVTLADLHAFVDGLAVSDNVKRELKAITPMNYRGIAKALVEQS